MADKSRKKISARKALEIMARNICTVRSFAEIIIEIDQDGCVEFFKNDNPRLGIIAIIGPPEAFAPSFHEEVSCKEGTILPEKVLLNEVGIGASRPFSKASGLKRKEGDKKIGNRKNWFLLSSAQYKIVAPLVFSSMQSRTDEKTGLWKNDPVFKGKISRTFYRRMNKKHQDSTGIAEFPKGLRYSVLRSSYFFGDVACAEIYANKQVTEELEGFSRYIDLLLNNKYKANDFHGERFLRLKYVRMIIDIMREQKKISALRVQRILDLGLVKDSRFRSTIAPILGANCDSLHDFLGEMHLPRYGDRTNGMQLRIVRYYPEYIVFEVFPSIPF